ncbi:MAG: AlkZ-related protein [Thermomicrobiales bacterium]
MHPVAIFIRQGGEEDSFVADALLDRRLENWCQTSERRIPDPVAAAQFIERIGFATLYPVSPEIPNLYHAHMGDPDAKTDSGHDSPSGDVYSWRWTLGRRNVAFYSAIVRNRPTWVSWPLLPAVLRLRGDVRDPADLHAVGELSGHALRVAQALESSGGVLSTGDLRRAAGFPTGKEHRAAYLKAVGELDTRLLLAKVFSLDDDEMYHALVRNRYPDYIVAAGAITREDALAQLLTAYLPAAVYTVPTVLAKDLRLPEPDLRTALDHLVTTGHAQTITRPNQRGNCYLSDLIPKTCPTRLGER